MNEDEAIRLAQHTDLLAAASFYTLAEALRVLADEVDRLRLALWRATDGGSGDSECQHGGLLTSPCGECAEGFAACQARKSS